MLKVDGLSISELQKRRSAKWSGYGDGVLPLPVAEMDFEIAEPIRKTLIEMLERSDTGYLGPVPELSINLAEFTKARWGWEIDQAQVFIATDVGVGMVEMARTIVSPGETILINSPVYHNFYGWIRELKCTAVDVPLKVENLNYSMDFAAIESAYAAGVKLHFICSPHNPVGTIFSKAELSQLADLAKRYGVAIFSDEVHAPLAYNAPDFVPFLSVSETAREVGICVTAASKAWNLAGLKCATIITQHQRWNQLALQMPESVHWRASLFGAVASAKAYECTEWLDAAIQTMDRNRHLLAKLLTEKLPDVGYRIPDFGYLAWLDFTNLNLGDDPTAFILENAKVALNSGQSFQASSNQFARLNFATSAEILTLAIDKIAAAVNSKK
jgi:cystathionine beta-lyase